MICKWSVFVVAWSFSSHSHACAGCCLRRQSNQSITHSPCLACKAVASANHIPAALAYSVRGEAREAARDRLPPPVLPSIGNHTTHTHTPRTRRKQERTDALRHVNVVTRRSSTPILARLRVDRDCLRRANCLAQLAGNAALLARGIASQRVLTAKARRERALLKGVVQLLN